MMSLLPAHMGPENWEVPILKSIATKNQGIEETVQFLEEHYEFLQKSEGLIRENQRKQDFFKRLLENALVLRGFQKFENQILKAKKELKENPLTDPYSLALDIFKDEKD